MEDINRRTLLGTAGVLGAGAALGGSAAPAAAEASLTDAPGTLIDMGPAEDAVRRLLPDHSGQITLKALTSGKERFRVSGSAGSVEIAGTSPAVALTGLHWYLKYTCGAHISWSGSQLGLPKQLPAPGSPYERNATVPHRFMLNDTHDGYTAPYAGWEHWEHFIDVMALHGCNEVLVTTGSEGRLPPAAEGLRLLRRRGAPLDPRPLAPAVVAAPEPLRVRRSDQRRSARTPGGARPPHREAAAGAGHARRPAGLLRHGPRRLRRPATPAGRRSPRGTGTGSRVPPGSTRAPPSSARSPPPTTRTRRPSSARSSHVKMDLLHEGGKAGNVPVPDAARAVEKALQTALPGATWVILGWQKNPRRELLDALAAQEPRPGRRRALRPGADHRPRGGLGRHPLCLRHHPQLRRTHDDRREDAHVDRPLHRVARPQGQQARRHRLHAGVQPPRPGGLRAVQRAGVASGGGGPRAVVRELRTSALRRRRRERAGRVRHAPRAPRTRSAARTGARTTASSPPAPASPPARARTTPRTPPPSTWPTSTRR